MFKGFICPTLYVGSVHCRVSLCLFAREVNLVKSESKVLPLAYTAAKLLTKLLIRLKFSIRMSID